MRSSSSAANAPASPSWSSQWTAAPRAPLGESNARLGDAHAHGGHGEQDRQKSHAKQNLGRQAERGGDQTASDDVMRPPEPAPLRGRDPLRREARRYTAGNAIGVMTSVEVSPPTTTMSTGRSWAFEPSRTAASSVTPGWARRRLISEM